LRHDLRGGDKQIPLLNRSVSVLSRREREASGYNYRVAPGRAITGNGDNETPVQSQPGRDKTVAGNEGGGRRTLPG